MTSPLYPKGQRSDLGEWWDEVVKGSGQLATLVVFLHVGVVAGAVRTVAGPDRRYYATATAIAAAFLAAFWVHARRTWRRVTGVAGDAVVDPWPEGIRGETAAHGHGTFRARGNVSRSRWGHEWPLTRIEVSGGGIRTKGPLFPAKDTPWAEVVSVTESNRRVFAPGKEIVVRLRDGSERWIAPLRPWRFRRELLRRLPEHLRRGWNGRVR